MHSYIFTSLLISIYTIIYNLQEEEDSLHVDYKKERLVLEQKYNELRTIKYMKRLDIVNANANDTASSNNDSNNNNSESASNGVETIPNPKLTLDIGVLGFWLQVLANHPIVGQYIEEGDVGALTHLEDISCNYNEDMSTFTLLFLFKDNPYFRNRVSELLLYGDCALF